MSGRSTVKKIIPSSLFRMIEPYGHLLETKIYDAKNGFPAKGLHVIGVTGTDGKTTTCTLITSMLRSAGYKVAMMTTISIDYGDGTLIANPSRLTTLGAAKLFSEIKKIRQAGAEWLVLETTSHALAQHRVAGIPFEVAVMTNINHEHLDYHGTFERYRDAKKHLFTLTSQNRTGRRVGIINADDRSADLFAAAISRPITYGIMAGDMQAKSIQSSATGSTFVAVYGDRKVPVSVLLPGRFNIYNAMATVGVGIALGLSDQQIHDGIASLAQVEGRMAIVDEGQPFTVLVDYAHTPDSFEKIIQEARPLTKGRLLVLFGSAGRRDEAKRAQQGAVAGRLADMVFVTEEDDRDMDGEQILNQIAQGAEDEGKKRGVDLFLIHDRPNAVREAILSAQPGDTVLLLGKGHEKSILRNGPQAAELREHLQDDTDRRRVIKVDYDEVTVARETLKQVMASSQAQIE